MSDMHIVRRGTPAPINSLLFYEDGFENESVTGGWEVSKITGNSATEKNADNLYALGRGTSSSRAGAIWGTVGDLNFSEINTLHATVRTRRATTHDTNSTFGFAVGDESVLDDMAEGLSSIGASVYQRTDVAWNSYQEGIYSLDVSAINGDLKIYLSSSDRGLYTVSDTEIEIIRVWGEV